MSNQRTLIVGIGSPHGDDQVGWLIVEGLNALATRGNIELQVAKSPADLLDWLDRNDRLVICDASHGLGRPGEIRRWTWPASEISSISMSGTHNLSLPTVLALAEKVCRLPDDVTIWTIEGREKVAVESSSAHTVAGVATLREPCQSARILANPATGLSPEVFRAIPELVNRIVDDLKNAQNIMAKSCTNNP